MHRSIMRRHRLAVSLVALAALVAACGGTTSPSGSAAASSGAPPVASSSAAAGSAIAGRPLDIQIAPPYNLADLAASKAETIQAGIEKNLGAYGKAVHVTVKEVQQSGTVAAYLMVVAFPRGTLDDNIYKQVVLNLSMGAESDFTPKLIGAVPVSFGTMSGGSVAVFRTGDLVLITLAPQTADLTPVVTALVKANG